MRQLIKNQIVMQSLSCQLLHDTELSKQADIQIR